MFDRYDNKKTIFASTGYMDEHADRQTWTRFSPLAERYDKAFVRRPEFPRRFACDPDAAATREQAPDDNVFAGLLRER